jgi:hypothetical protein
LVYLLDQALDLLIDSGEGIVDGDDSAVCFVDRMLRGKLSRF